VPSKQTKPRQTRTTKARQSDPAKNIDNTRIDGNCWVIYLDIYGFSHQVRTARKNETHEKLRDCLNRIKSRTAQYKFILHCLSDSIFIVAPTRTKRDFATLRNSISITKDALDDLVAAGFLPRGALSHGQIFGSQQIILGDPIIDAVALERNLSVPAVFVPTRTLMHYAGILSYECDAPTKDFGLIRAHPIFPRTTGPFRTMVENRRDKALLSGPPTVARALTFLIELLDAHDAHDQQSAKSITGF
jgi:hypothetical protein